MGSEKESYQFFDNLLFPKIFRTFRMAVQPGKLIIAFSALAIICLAGWIMDFSRTVVIRPVPQSEIKELKTDTAKPDLMQTRIKVPVKTVIIKANAQDQVTELQIYMAAPDLVRSFIEANEETGARTGVFSTLWHFGSARFHGALKSLFAFDLPAVAANIAECFKAARWTLRYHYIYSIIFFAITLAVISIAGGSLCRIAALQFARGEKPGLTEAIRFSTKKFPSLFTTPLVPIGIVIFIGLFVFLLGLIGNIPWVGELIIGISMPLALIAGALIAVVLIGAAAGFNLMFPAIVYDGSDCFDAISRSFSYVYAKPWRMGFYTAVAAVYGAICYMFVRFFAFLLLWATRWFLQLGVWVENSKEVNKLTALWPEPSFMNLSGSSDLAAANWAQSIAAFLMHLSLLAVIGLVVSFIISFYFSANTIIYASLRNRVDGTALDDIT